MVKDMDCHIEAPKRDRLGDQESPKGKSGEAETERGWPEEKAPWSLRTGVLLRVSLLLQSARG